MMRNLARAVRRIFIRLKLYELPRLFAPLAKGKWMLVLLITGIVLLLIGLSPFPLPELRIELPLGLLELSLSLQELAQYGVPVGLGLVVLALLGWGIGHWAAPRALFWEAIKDRGITVVWYGEKEDFREHLDEAMGFALGRGPSGLILPDYVPRPEEEKFLSLLKNDVWGRPKKAYGVVISGPPAAGKSRTAMELLSRLNLPFVLVWPRGQVNGRPYPSGMKLPVSQAVILTDDLLLKPGGEGPSLPEGLANLLHCCPELALIATARKDRIPPDVRGVHVVELQPMGWDECKELAQKVAQVEGRPLTDVSRRFNGHPGSLVAGLEVFQQRYADLPDEMGRVLRVQSAAERDRLGKIGWRFLQSARALWGLGVRTLTLERIWAVVEKAGAEPVVLADRDRVLRAMEELTFLRVEREKRPEVARLYEALLTEVIPQEEEWERTTWEVLHERKDAAAFVEIGNTWSEEYSPAYQHNPREALRKAIKAYQEALRFYTPEVAPLDYAMTQNNLGNAYADLALHEEPAGNLRRAIEAYKEALHSRTPEVAPLDYAMTQNNLGLAYRQRAELQTDPAQRCTDLQAAVKAFREALRFRTPEATPRLHAKTRQALEEAEEALRKAGCPEAT